MPGLGKAHQNGVVIKGAGEKENVYLFRYGKPLAFADEPGLHQE